MLTPTPPDLPLSASQHRVLPLDTILHGDCLDVLRGLPDASVDAVVTDPPAGISFMGKGWDSDKGGRDAWIAWLSSVMREALRVLKPGGHALVWALPRTSHWTAMALEDAGFEVRDCVTHLFGSGFPKSLDVSKQLDKTAGAKRHTVGVTRGGVQPGGRYGDSHMRETDKWHPVTAPATDAARQWDGWGTALKPAAEFWWLCRKPLSEGTVAGNVLAHGVGALNIAASRVAHDGEKITPNVRDTRQAGEGWTRPWMEDRAKDERRQVAAYERMQSAGRWPANLLLSHAADCDETHGCSLWCPVRELDAQSGVSRSPKQYTKSQAGYRTQYVGGAVKTPDLQSAEYGDTGGASRYFATFRYQAKASRAERNRGCEALDAKANRINAPRTCEGENFSPSQNHHPTVKPLALMSWLIGLITPPGGIVLDPFAGSGSTLVAAKQGGWRYIGVEREAEYVAICEARLAAVSEPSLGSATAMEQPKPASKPRRKAAKPPTTQVEPLWEIAQ